MTDAALQTNVAKGLEPAYPEGSSSKSLFGKPRMIRNGKTWHIMIRMGATATIDAAWVSLGGCLSQIIAMRVWLALMVRGEP